MRWVLRDLVSRSHCELLESTLRDYGFRSLGGYGSHFIFFNAAEPENQLAPDGYDNRQAPHHFAARRWLGGELRFHRDLRLGHWAQCTETLAGMSNVDPNKTCVTVHRQVHSTDPEPQLYVEETRRLVYLSRVSEAGYKKLRPPSEPSHMKTLWPTQTLIFRYSALTYNAHKIHYDRDFCRREGLADLVVQGPLLVTLLLRWFTSICPGYSVGSFSYKNVQPLYCGKPMTLCAKPDKTGFMVWIQSAGSLAMTGRIKWPSSAIKTQSISKVGSYEKKSVN